MSKRRRSKQRISKPLAPLERGFDFGVELCAAFVSDPSFVELLKRAKIVGCAHAYVPKGPLGPPIQQVALIGVHANPLVKAFAEFNRWAASGGGDAVELVFIFLKDGGYLLSVQREWTRALRDLQRSDRTYTPMLVGGTYIKVFSTRHAAIQNLRDYKAQFLISPFLFGAAIVKTDAGTVPGSEDVEPLETAEPLLKFEAEFLDEQAMLPSDRRYPLLAFAKQPKAPRTKKKGPLPPSPRATHEPGECFRHRASMLERHFPVTMERFRTGRYSELSGKIRDAGARDWQLKQAVCNLLLSSSICNGDLFYPNIPSKEFTKRVAQAIQAREERSDTPEPSQFSSNDIIAQARLDAQALLHERGQTPSLSATLDALQAKLAELGLLDPPNG